MNQPQKWTMLYLLIVCGHVIPIWTERSLNSKIRDCKIENSKLWLEQNSFNLEGCF